MEAYADRIRERYYRRLLENKFKLTIPRKAIIELLLANPGRSLTADDVLGELNGEQPGTVSRATVYRNIDTLCETGILKEAGRNGHGAMYELDECSLCTVQLVDVNTGEITEVQPDAQTERMLRRLTKRHGFASNCRVIEFYGSFNGASLGNGQAKNLPAPADNKGC